jgi:hypothetical protein
MKQTCIPAMKPHAAALAAWLAIGCAPASAAVITDPAVRHESLADVVIHGEVVVESETRSAGGGAPHEKLAFAGEAGKRSEVRIITSGSAAAIDFAGGHDVDALVSKAMAEAFAGGTVAFGRSVKNAPYSAEVITEKTQVLADGNQIIKRTSNFAFRDSAGRTRQETRDANGNPKSIHIHDVVDGSRLTLIPHTRTALKMTVNNDLNKRVAELKEKAKAMVKDGQATVIERSSPNEEIVIHRSEGGGDGRKEVREDVQVRVVTGTHGGKAVSLPRVEVFKSGDYPALGDLMRLSPIGGALGDGKWSGKATTTPLGVRDFDGVRAEGKSTSYTIPAGEIGNRNPIVVSTETWFSPELQTTVYSRHSDPRSGETVYRMVNIKRSEPPASLFTVPDGYSVKETPGFNYKFRTEKSQEKN